MNNKKNNKKVSNVMLVVSCAMIILYTAANFVLQYYTNVEVSPTITEKWFQFWSAELFLIAGIKISKVFKGKDNSYQDDIIEKTIEEEVDE